LGHSKTAALCASHVDLAEPASGELDLSLTCSVHSDHGCFLFSVDLDALAQEVLQAALRGCKSVSGSG
jgi:hypothetical protein